MDGWIGIKHPLAPPLLVTKTTDFGNEKRSAGGKTTRFSVPFKIFRHKGKTQTNTRLVIVQTRQQEPREFVEVSRI